MIETIIWLLVSMLVATFASMLGKHYGVSYLIGIFTSAIVVANAIAPKIISIGSLTTTASVAVYSVTFLVTDSISEFYGKRHATKAVWSGFLGVLLFVFVAQNVIALTPASFWGNQEAFETIFSSTFRIAIASMVAYLISQTHDVWAYHFWKKKTKGRLLWLRNCLSTGTSQVISSTLFVTIGFIGTAPLWPLIWGSVLIKLIIALLDTPFLYFIRYYYNKEEPWSKARNTE
jgi:queuosine precursor transporter